ncbi:Bbp16 family capsid cement protein [Sphingomonas qomolangmaensis]|uniref:Uncharacterized protein n=1 Tax=Sphingomonas qomolangmaensis TaxID=2918765 RepID=A0ABY5LBQ7_9SPHN|nr:hypothetical protein [Sphingomonas qomolangmaensis]UUL83453.1 hypothetical protein NMP03_04280 [Sphingomonas qomolangmaensis]
MLTDKELLCSEWQAITGAAVSDDSLLMRDLVGADRTRKLRCFAAVEADFAGAATGITVDMIQADNSALTANVEVLGTTGAIAADLLGQRVLVDTPLPATTKPYFGFRFTPQGGSFTAGSITAGLTTGIETRSAERPRFETHGY